MTKERRGKVQSINFEDDAFKLLSNEVARYKSNYTSLINRLVYSVLGLSKESKDELALFAFQQSLKLKDSATKEAEFQRESMMNRSDEYTELCNLLTYDKGAVNKEQINMQRIEMKDAYLLCPHEWIVLNSFKPEESTIAYAIEFLNGDKFELPHFVCFADEPIEDWQREDFLKEAAKKDEHFAMVKAKYADSAFAPDGRILNAKELATQPVPGFFEIAKKGSDSSFPYGAMVVAKED